MTKHSEGLQHYEIRKRIYKKHEQYPHPDKWKRLIDNVIYPIGIISPIVSFPQLLEVWVSKNVSGLSLFTWTSWAFFDIFWLIYGIAHKQKPIIITYAMWLMVNLGVVVGIIIYR